MHFAFTIKVEVERQQGKFASREELEELIRGELEGAQPSSLEGENGGEYAVTDWTVEVQDQPKRRRRRG